MADNKTKATQLSVAAYIDALTDEAKRADAKALVKLMQSATGEEPKMWGPSILGFGSYHYKYESGREGDMPVVGFSPRRPAHGSVWPAWIQRCRGVALQARQTHHRQGLRLRQEARRRGPEGVRAIDRKILRRQVSSAFELRER
jgi:hypothetical protein